MAFWANKKADTTVEPIPVEGSSNTGRLPETLALEEIGNQSESAPKSTKEGEEGQQMFQNRIPSEREKPQHSANAPTVIRAGLHLDGNIKTPNDVLLEGSITGEVTANAITVAAGATLSGTVSAAVIVVHGTIDGVVRCIKLQVNTSGAVRGEIHHNILVVEAGAAIEGTIFRTERPGDAVLQQVEETVYPGEGEMSYPVESSDQTQTDRA